ncbi:MAG: hypothetical protein WCR27_09525 [Eubacteriales bacterium]
MEAKNDGRRKKETEESINFERSRKNHHKNNNSFVYCNLASIRDMR